MAIDLRQSTASQEVPLGYFVDSTDGNTEETGLTIANTDIKIWKTGATTLADKNSGGATHISNGLYYTVLDATDTNTIGPLVIFVHVSGALAVKVECRVLDEAVYDVMYGTTAISTYAGADTSGTTTLLSRIGTPSDLGGGATISQNLSDIEAQTDDIGAAGAGLTAVPWNSSWDAEMQSEVQDAIEANNLDHIAGTATAIPAVPAGTYLDQIMDDGTAAYDRTTDSLQAIRDHATTIETDTQDIQGRLPAALTGGGNMKSDLLALNGVTASASKLERSASTIVTGTVDTGAFTATTTEFEADDITEATADHYNGRIIIFTSGALTGQATDITDYALSGANGHFTVTALTEAPANDITFVIV